MSGAPAEDEANYVYGRLIEAAARAVANGEELTLYLEQIGASEAALRLLTERFAERGIRAEVIGDRYRMAPASPLPDKRPTRLRT